MIILGTFDTYISENHALYSRAFINDLINWRSAQLIMYYDDDNKNYCDRLTCIRDVCILLIIN